MRPSCLYRDSVWNIVLGECEGGERKYTERAHTEMSGQSSRSPWSQALVPCTAMLTVLRASVSTEAPYPTTGALRLQTPPCLVVLLHWFSESELRFSFFSKKHFYPLSFLSSLQILFFKLFSVYVCACVSSYPSICWQY